MAISTGKLETILRACERAGMRVLELIVWALGFAPGAFGIRQKVTSTTGLKD